MWTAVRCWHAVCAAKQLSQLIADDLLLLSLHLQLTLESVSSLTLLRRCPRRMESCCLMPRVLVVSVQFTVLRRIWRVRLRFVMWVVSEPACWRVIALALPSAVIMM
jgi:hypothetical protein